MELEGAVALVTGANRGIGAAIVEALVAAGARRVYVGARNPAQLAFTDKEVPIPLDITNRTQVAQAALDCRDVNVLVNNAGITFGEPLLRATHAEAAEDEMRVNYFGTLYMARAFAPILARNGGGAIVNVLSILARVSAPLHGSYSASKAAAFSLTQGLRAELAAQGTRVVGVLPGFVDTAMTQGVTSPKLAPSAVAQSIIEALRTEAEDVYPGEAAGIASALQADPKGVERRFAALFGPRAVRKAS